MTRNDWDYKGLVVMTRDFLGRLGMTRDDLDD